MKISEMRDALTILLKYGDGHHFYAEHDQVWAGAIDVNEVTDDDKESLESLRWFIDLETESWTAFV